MTFKPVFTPLALSMALVFVGLTACNNDTTKSVQTTKNSSAVGKAPAGASIHGTSIVYTVEGEFADVKETLTEAVTERGLVISYTSHAKTMIDNTMKTFGYDENVYSDAEILLFCQAKLSQQLVRESPHNISLCPYAISIYSVKGESGKVYLSYRQPPIDEKAYAPISDLLHAIATQVQEDA